MNFNVFKEEINSYNTHVIDGDLYLGGVQYNDNDVFVKRDVFGNYTKRISNADVVNVAKQFCNDYVLYNLVCSSGVMEIKSLNREGEKLKLTKASDLDITNSKLFDEGITFLSNGKMVIGTDLSRLNINNRAERHLRKMLNDFFVKVNFDDKTKAMCYIVDPRGKSDSLFDIGIIDVETQTLYAPTSEKYKKFYERSSYFYKIKQTGLPNTRYSARERSEYMRAYNNLMEYAIRVTTDYSKLA